MGRGPSTRVRPCAISRADRRLPRPEAARAVRRGIAADNAWGMGRIGRQYRAPRAEAPPAPGCPGYSQLGACSRTTTVAIDIARFFAGISEKPTLCRSLPLSRAREGPSLFPFPDRGEWRAEATRDLDYSQILPDRSGVTRGLRVRRTVPVRLAVRRATRHYRFRVHGQSDRCRESWCSRGATRCRPRTWLACATLAGAASRPTFTTPRDDAPRWTGLP